MLTLEIMLFCNQSVNGGKIRSTLETPCIHECGTVIYIWFSTKVQKSKSSQGHIQILDPQRFREFYIFK